MPRNGGDRDRERRPQRSGDDYPGVGGGDADDRRRQPSRKFYRNNDRYHGGGGGGGGYRYGKNRNYNSGGDRGDNRGHRYYKRAKFDVGERLKEVDLGITEYVGDAEGFTGTIKERYTDFLVHEISLNGEIAKLTTQDLPPDPEENLDIEDLKKKIPEGVWEKLAKLSEDSSVEIDVTDIGKDQRKIIHQIVKIMNTVYSDTKEVGDKKLMVFSKQYSTNQYGRRDNRKDWSTRGGDYCHFVLHKYGMDTMDALSQISGILRLRSNAFSYAGTKDRRAKTSQWISIKKVSPNNIKNAAFKVRGAFVGNFKFEKESLKLGKLYGNRFTLVLRNVTADDDVIEKAMVSLRDNGFINYYGLQRFGTIAAIPTHEIGKALLQGNWAEAIDLILKPREGEQDRDLAEAREIYQQTKDARLAYQKIVRTDKIEAKLLHGLNLHGQNNYLGALDCIPRNTMLMYVHAYQSKVWNEIVSRRIKEFGLKPIAGDLVYENPDADDEFDSETHLLHSTDENGKTDEKVAADAASGTPDKKKDEQKPEDLTKVEETTDEKKEGDEKKEDDKKEDDKKEDDKKEDDKNSEKDDKLPKIKVLTEEDLSKYTMADIVMPQPGWKVVYPTYAQAWFEDQLEKDNLTPELKQKNKKYTLSGSYRKILEMPKHLSWSIIRYNNKDDDLILSDIDELRNVEAAKNIPDGRFKAVVLQMSLKSSAYATMALREATKCDTSPQTHAAQSAAAHKKEEAAQKLEEGKESSIASETESIPHVENLELKDRSSDELSQSTEIDAATSDKKSSTMLEDSIMEEEAHTALKSDDKINSTLLEDSNAEEKPLDKSISAEPLKHETDPTNDSGIETGHVISA